MRFQLLFTTLSLLPLLFPCLYYTVWQILLIVLVLSGGFSAHQCDCCHVSLLVVIGGFGEKGTNITYNDGATQ
jgi:hypothetical protein